MKHYEAPDRAAESAFWNFCKERHAIYQRRFIDRKPAPWTADPILGKYKFTNIYRELDRTTKWMRHHLTRPNEGAPPEDMIFNCAVFRMFGTVEFSQAIGGWIVYEEWDPKYVKAIARQRLAKSEKVFTGAYIITNAGRTIPKYALVVNEFLADIYDNAEQIAEWCTHDSLEYVHGMIMRSFRGWGGTGFMAYEVVSDLRHTDVLNKAKDIMTWANPGPGCVRGLNRIWNEGEWAKQKWPRDRAIAAMRYLCMLAPKRFMTMEMRDIEHSLCEFDKYQRVKLNEGRPRSLFTPSKEPLP